MLGKWLKQLKSRPVALCYRPPYKGLMKHLLTLFVALALPLAGCAATNTTQTSTTLEDIVRAERGAPIQGDNTCKVPAALIGKSAGEVAATKFDVPVRMVIPGGAVSGDHVSNRLNFKLDKKGMVREITCG